MSDEELLTYTRNLMEEKNITKPSHLQKESPGLYQQLRNRSLLESLIFKEKQNLRIWKKEAEMVEFAIRLKKEKGISNRKGLEREDPSLYVTLKKRGLLEAAGFIKKQKHRLWSTESELIEYALKLIAENGIKNRSHLAKIDQGLYVSLKKRKLFDSVGLGLDKKPRKQWKWGTDEQVLIYTSMVLLDGHITTPTELRTADPNLYSVLSRRGLLDSISFDEKQEHRSFGSDKEILLMARKFMEDERITKRSQLGKKDPSLYEALRKRGLLGELFSEVNETVDEAGLKDICEAVSEFGGGA